MTQIHIKHSNEIILLDKLNNVYYIYIVKIMGTKERKLRDKKEMEENILNAAMKLFLSRGYKNVTIRKIADEIEYSPATIYLYFKDKEEILLELQTRAFDKFYNEQKTVQNIKDPIQRLTAHGEVYIKFAIDNPEQYDLMFIMEQPVIKKPEDWHTGMNSYDLLRQNVKDCTDKGLLRFNDYETASFALWAFVHGIASILIKRGMVVPDEYKEAMIKGAFEFLRYSIYKKKNFYYLTKQCLFYNHSLINFNNYIMETKKYDAIVIGSGIGGLTLAAILSKLNKKKILVIEKHWVLGGQTHDFHRKGKFKWDVGIHYVPGMDEKDMTKEVFDYITNGKLKWNKLPYEFEKFIYPDFTFVVPANKTEYINKLIEQFPNEEKAIKKYFKDIDKVARWGSTDIAKKVLPFYVRFFLNIYSSFNKKKALRTTGDYLNSHFKNEKLKALLASQWGDYGLPPSKSAFSIHALIVQSYLNGAYYPQGGGKSIASSIKPVIEKAGGKFLLNTEVTGLIIENNTAVGVKVKPVKGNEKEAYEIYAPLIFSNAGAYNTYKYLLKEKSDSEIMKSIENIQTGDSVVSLYVGFKEDPSKLGFTGGNNWICEDYDHDKVQKENDLLTEPKFGFLSFPSLKSNDGYNHTAEIISFVNYKMFEKWENSRWRNRCEEYYKMKEKITNNLLDLVEKHFKGFKDLICYTELSTPLTMKSFVNWNKGMYNGIPAVPERFKMKFLKPKTDIRNFYMTGCDVSSLGIVGAMMGGVAAASLVNGGLGFFKIIATAKKEKALKEKSSEEVGLNPSVIPA